MVSKKKSLKPLHVFIEKANIPLRLDQTKYVFRLLLKTGGFPYRFVKHPKNADIVYAAKEHNSKLFIKSDKNLNKFIENNCNKKIVERHDIPFIIFDSNNLCITNFLSKKKKRTIVSNDIIFSAFYLIVGFHEKEMPRKKNDICDATKSFLYNQGYLYKPLVNIYSNFIRRIFYISHCPVDIWPGGKKYALALTHDCDYIEMKRYIEALRYLLTRNPSKNLSKIFEILFSKKQTFWNFNKWISLEESYGLKSTFYFCSIKGSMLTYYIKTPNPFYDIKKPKFRQLFNDLRKKGIEIGLHSSFNAYLSKNKFRKEREKLMRLSGTDVLGNRHHSLHVSPQNFIDTARIHNDVGFLYDCSLGFNYHSGFRRSISTPFTFFDEKTGHEFFVLSIPLSLMDAQIFGTKKQNFFKKKEKVIDSVLDSIKRYNGLLVVNYHVRCFNEDLFPSWKKSCIYLLDKIASHKDFYSDTLVNIALYWQKRDKILEENSYDETI